MDRKLLLPKVLAISSLLEPYSLKWAITGGANCVLRGAKANTKDIDIITTVRDSAFVASIISGATVHRRSRSISSNISSVFYSIRFMNCDVEIMGGPINYIDGEWKRNLKWVHQVDHITTSAGSINAMSIRYEERINRELGNISVANALFRIIANENRVETHTKFKST